MATDNDSRRCPKCEQSLPLSAFGRDKCRRDGITCWCKACKRSAVDNWTSKNVERFSAYQKEWRAANIDSVRAKRVERYQLNRDRERQQVIAYRKLNKEKVRGWRRAWRKANPEYGRRCNRAFYQRHKAEYILRYIKPYRARRRGAEGRFTKSDVERISKAQRFKCAYCPTSIRQARHIDHIVALRNGGSNWPSNIQLTCGPCNLSKGASDPIDFARRIGRLL